MLHSMMYAEIGTNYKMLLAWALACFAAIRLIFEGGGSSDQRRPQTVALLATPTLDMLSSGCIGKTTSLPLGT